MDKTINYLNFEIFDGSKIFKVFDYNSFCLNKIKYYFGTLPSYYFKYIKLEQGSKIEKVCYDYYKNSSYYDLILILNNREMIYDMPYMNDIILSAIEKDLDEYKRKIFNDPFKKLSDKSYNDLYKKLENNYETKNLKLQFLKVIDINLMPEVIADINEIIEKYQNNIELLDLDE